MANTPFGLTTKALIFLPLASAVYFFDLQPWLTQLEKPATLTVFLLAISAFALGVFFRRRAIRISFEISEISFATGLFFVALSAALFVLGSYSSQPVWVHFESLILLLIGYVVLRVGIGVVRLMAPMLLIIAVAFVPFSAFSISVASILMLLLSLWIGVAFMIFVGLRPNQFIFAALLILFALCSWAASTAAHLPFLAYLVPAPLLLLSLPQARRFAGAPNDKIRFQCPSHKVLPSGFCSYCGRKVSGARTTENFGGWGLLAVGIVVVILLISSVPALAIGAGPYDETFTPRGSILTPLPVTPSGWQVNSTILDSWNASTRAYETVRIYVPLVNPEVKNYTVYYSVAPDTGVPSAPSGIIPTWNWVSSAFTPLAGFQGRVTTYTLANKTMLSYGGSRTMSFVSGTGVLTDYVTVGFVRVFKNTNVTADTAQFLSDIQGNWIPSLVADSFFSSWTDFLRSTMGSISNLTPLVETIASVSIIAWIGYRFITREEKRDRFYSKASLTKDRDWFVLSELIGAPRRQKAGYELSSRYEQESGSYQQLSEEEVDSTLKELSTAGLVKPVIVSTANDALLTWKAKT